MQFYSPEPQLASVLLYMQTQDNSAIHCVYGIDS